MWLKVNLININMLVRWAGAYSNAANISVTLPLPWWGAGVGKYQVGHGSWVPG